VSAARALDDRAAASGAGALPWRTVRTRPRSCAPSPCRGGGGPPGGQRSTYAARWRGRRGAGSAEGRPRAAGRVRGVVCVSQANGPRPDRTAAHASHHAQPRSPALAAHLPAPARAPMQEARAELATLRNQLQETFAETGCAPWGTRRLFHPCASHPPPPPPPPPPHPRPCGVLRSASRACIALQLLQERYAHAGLA
jgi:hypothetical protein